MIKDPEAYRRLSELEDSEELSRMSIDESIALGEALLTSELMTLAVFADDDRPMSLARALGIGIKRR